MLHPARRYFKYSFAISVDAVRTMSLRLGTTAVTSSTTMVISRMAEAACFHSTEMEIPQTRTSAQLFRNSAWLSGREGRAVLATTL